MLLNTRKLAFLGLLLALDVILIVLSSVIEINTLFLLAAASFCVGIAIRESGKRFGFGFYLASILLGLILTPNKLYCITYAAFGLYLVIVEYSYDKLVQVKEQKNRRLLFWIIKYIAFNLMFLPILIFLPKLVYQGTINSGLIAVLVLAGQVALLIFDKAYEYFQRVVWGKVRGRFKL
jgi:hypothetical protein